MGRFNSVELQIPADAAPTSVFALDTSPPVERYNVPSNGASEVNVFGFEIAIAFDENIAFAPLSEPVLLIDCGGDMICGNVNAKDDRIAAFGDTDVRVRIRGSLLYLSPAPHEVARRKYSLAIPPGTVADLYGNEFEGIPPDTYTFHTFKRP